VRRGSGGIRQTPSSRRESRLHSYFRQDHKRLHGLPSSPGRSSGTFRSGLNSARIGRNAKNRSLRLQDVKLLSAGTHRVGQSDGIIIRATHGDGIGPNRPPQVWGRGVVRAGQQIEVPAEQGGGVRLQIEVG
jgi:hypothetical protein